jgi:hypothetical protein
MKINIKRYMLYLLRWQLSTPILAWCVIVFAMLGPTWATVIANLIGGMIFYFVDQFIFKSDKLNVSWEVKEEVICVDCKKNARGYRLVKSNNYDKRHDKHPEFRCEKCSEKKLEELRNKGVYVKHI